MATDKKTETPMTKLARFIVDKRKAFFLVFIAAVIFCGASVSKVQINNDITSYLPENTETRRGLTLMEEQFVTLATADVMVSNVTYDAADALAQKLEQVEGVSEVTFDDTADHYKGSAALFSISFDGETGDQETVEALHRVEALLEGYDVSLSTEVGRDISASLRQEMTVILLIAAAVIVVVPSPPRATWRCPSTSSCLPRRRY